MKIIQLKDTEYIDDILEIEHSSFSMPWTRGMFVIEFVKDMAFYLGAMVDDKVISYAGMWKIFDEGHITNIAVSPDYRGQGIGTKLIQGLIDECKKSDINAITLEVRVSNEAAKNLYTKMGFEIAGKRKAYYEDNKEDALIMWKKLT